MKNEFEGGCWKVEGGRISLYSEIRRKEGFKVKLLPSTLSYSP
jgi:hypothetical protein